MGLKKRTLVSLLFVFCFSLLQIPSSAATKSYVVYLGAHGSAITNEESVIDSHNELLGSILKDKEKAKASIFYYYTNHINGFAANLEEEEAKELSNHPNVVSVFLNKIHKLHTTHSWQFMGLENLRGKLPPSSIWRKANFGEDVIVANMDTGVWPESESFKDDGYASIPSRWKGTCDPGDDKNFKCNRKLIGARYFNKGMKAGDPDPSYKIPNYPRDDEGHGSHTLSTAAGNMVTNASIFGYAEGIAKGGAPRARVAAYKVCWEVGCTDADIMKGFDTAIHDGVDVISLSLGGMSGPYLQDGIAIASFHATSKGIIVASSAGNDGPLVGSVTNVSPWVITVGASTIDREFPSYISFNNQHIKGQSLSAKFLPEKYYPMINAADAALPNDTVSDAAICSLGSLDPKKVQGKIVVCLRGSNARTEKGEAVLQSGGIGMVLANDELSGDEIIADPHILPATHISYSDGLKLYSYLNSTKSPLGSISSPKTKINTKPSPTMAAFSSQGPNTVSLEILKPDITAPGVNVLAAYTQTIGPIPDKFDTRRVPYIIMSGTSMSCPHIAGVAALLKAVHPSWSPSRIKSAIMTSAQILDNTGSLIKDSVLNISTPYNYGSGHVAPNRAMSPGLVYDLSVTDYLSFLCSSGYNSTDLKTFLGETYSCPKVPMVMEDLNYPSISVPHLAKRNITVTRTLTNVGRPGTYKVSVEEPKDVSVTVKPTVLKFSKHGEKHKYTVRFETTKKNLQGSRFGRLVWSDGKHNVGTPIAAEFLLP